ncbi:MAG: sulfatase-like hydrolase/transferase, partial [Verrucomicrobiota bacterium]
MTNSRIQVALTLLFVFEGHLASAADQLSKPNIVLIMSDDQGWGQVGYMNHPHLKGNTPNLDAMAENGIRFHRFYAAA